MKQDIYYDFMEDNHFTELKDTEILTERLRLLGDIDSYAGKYFSEQWIRTNVLRMTEDEVAEIEKQINQEGGGEGPEDDEPMEEVIHDEIIEEMFEPPEEMTEEEKRLVEKMTKVLDDVLTED